MRIARETDYAIRCLLFLGEQPERTRTVGNISGPQKIPASFLAKILQKLARAGILSSARGTGGGFRLARPPDEITLLQVIEAIEGPLALNDCLVDGRHCDRAHRCAGHFAWQEIQKELAGTLAGYTLRGLLDRERDASTSELLRTAEET